MNRHLRPVTPSPRSGVRPQPTVGALPPGLAALALGLPVGVLLVALGAPIGIALGVAVIVAAVTGLVAAALRIADDWVRGDERGDR